MLCFWKSGGKYVISTGVKLSTPVDNHTSSVTDNETNGIQETEQRRSGIRAPVIKVDETKNSIVKHRKSSK